METGQGRQGGQGGQGGQRDIKKMKTVRNNEGVSQHERISSDGRTFAGISTEVPASCWPG